MAQSDGQAQDLLRLYRDEVRAFFAENQVTGLETLDQMAGLLEGALGQKTHLNVGFVGESQVGKSTLINAVLGTRALPTGGIGPLTAQATRVSFGEPNSFTVEYHPKGQVHRFAFGLERYLERRGVLPPRKEKTPQEIEPDDELEELEGEPSSPSAASEKGEHMLKQAKTLMFTQAGQLAPRPADDLEDVLALDGVLVALGQPPRGLQEALVPHAERVADLTSKLGAVETVTAESGDGSAFNRDLRMRAAGWLSPLVAKLDVRLDSALLNHLSLTDLPGVGSLGGPWSGRCRRLRPHPRGRSRCRLSK